MNTKIWHPYTRFSAIEQEHFPMIKRGEGPFLFDSNGTRYIDAIASWWCLNLGHSHPRIVGALQHQSAELQHSILGNMYHEPAIQLSEKLTTLMPTPDRHVHYAADGSSANELAIKISRQFFTNTGQDQRTLFLSLDAPYHGDTIGSLSVGYYEQFHKPYQPLTFKNIQLPLPTYPKNRTYPEVNALEQTAFDTATELFEKHGNHIAGLFVETLCQGTNGMRMYGVDYLQHLATLCQQYGALLICDEIAMGMGRTGRMFAFEHAGIDPDIVTTAKGLTAGCYPLSACIVKDHIYETFSDTPQDHTFYHGHTYAGNPVGCAIALEALAVYEELNICTQVKENQARIAHLLAPLESHPAVADLRHLGMVNAIEFHHIDPDLRHRLRARHILIRPLGNVLYLMLPLNTPTSVIEEVCEALIQEIR